ncbi:MAG TPA: carboxypeptidase-like regulatory domain-containing protein, partial [Cytophagaceae bacterium]
MAIPSAVCQQKYTISAVVKDSSSGETLPGATVLVEGQRIGATTNEAGFFSLTLPEGTYTLQFLFTGFQSKKLVLELNKNIHLDIEIPENISIEQEVIVTSDKSTKNVDRVEMGLVELDIEKIRALPAMMGEVDIMKTIQLLPGIQAGGEGNTGLYVRGGGADQNLVLLDDALIYNTGHL